MGKNILIITLLLIAGYLAYSNYYWSNRAKIYQDASSNFETAYHEQQKEVDNLKSPGEVDRILYGSPAPTSKPVSSKDPHAGMKEVKGMDCQPQGNKGATNCTEYDYWYNPNDLPSNNMQGTGAVSQ